MKLNKFAYLCPKPLGNNTLKIMKKYLEIMEFCQSEKVGTLIEASGQVLKGAR